MQNIILFAHKKKQYQDPQRSDFEDPNILGNDLYPHYIY